MNRWWTESPAFKVNNRIVKYKQWSYEAKVTEKEKVYEGIRSSGEIQLKNVIVN